MHIVFAASECVPFAKTGGLADVVGALGPELAKLGHRVTVYLPFYPRVRRQLEGEPRFAVRSITVPFSYYNRFVGVVDGGLRAGVQYYFLDCPEMFGREDLYGENGGEFGDNAERFALFCRAVIEASKQLGVPDVFHVHDWQASMIPVYLRTVYAGDPALHHAGVVLTIHNAAYQGKFPPRTTEQLLLPWDLFRMDRVEHYDRFNYLKGAMVYSDILTTVSRKYAEEIRTAEFGEGLDGVLRSRGGDVRGILNGVDSAQWNPATDKLIAANYTPERLEGKRKCREDLLRAFGMEKLPDRVPVVGIVSRFVRQKGFDMVAAVADELTSRELAVVALGTGEPVYERFFKSWVWAGQGRVRVEVRYDNVLAHKIEAGADIFLMPSRYEPCGLNQIYSLKYGTVPVVRATGGLDDTIEEWNPERGTGTGFKFAGYDPHDLLAAMDRAVALFGEKKRWARLMRNGMARNYDWTQPAREYAAVYEEAARRRA